MKKTKKTMKVIDFEQKVLEVEDVVIIIRADRDKKLGDFHYERQASGTTSVKDWFDTRIKPLVGRKGVEIRNGEYSVPHGRTTMNTLRKSYEK